jgi:thiol-disulfide isomerase/thioredoxin
VAATRPSWIGWAGAVVVAGLIAVTPPACVSDSGSQVPESPAEPAKLDYVLKDMDGKDVKLADFKGRPLIINFWATWCPPCKEEIPIFVELVEKYRDQKLTVLGISTSDTAEQLRPFAAEYRINYPILVGAGHDELLDTYETYSIPVSWFVRTDGTVYMKKLGSDTKAWFETQIKALF